MASTPPLPRRDQSRPDMVPLSDFGKAPPPPPRAKTNWRNVAIAIAVIVLIVGVSGYAIAAAQSGYQSAWGSTKCLDARKGC